jgi:hypothetical protein
MKRLAQTPPGRSSTSRPQPRMPQATGSGTAPRRCGRGRRQPGCSWRQCAWVLPSRAAATRQPAGACKLCDGMPHCTDEVCADSRWQAGLFICGPHGVDTVSARTLGRVFFGQDPVSIWAAAGSLDQLAVSAWPAGRQPPHPWLPAAGADRHHRCTDSGYLPLTSLIPLALCHHCTGRCLLPTAGPTCVAGLAMTRAGASLELRCLEPGAGALASLNGSTSPGGIDACCTPCQTAGSSRLLVLCMLRSAFARSGPETAKPGRTHTHHLAPCLNSPVPCHQGRDARWARITRCSEARPAGDAASQSGPWQKPLNEAPLASLETASTTAVTSLQQATS